MAIKKLWEHLGESDRSVDNSTDFLCKSISYNCLLSHTVNLIIETVELLYFIKSISYVVFERCLSQEYVVDLDFLPEVQA